MVLQLKKSLVLFFSMDLETFALCEILGLDFEKTVYLNYNSPISIY